MSACEVVWLIDLLSLGTLTLGRGTASFVRTEHNAGVGHLQRIRPHRPTVHPDSHRCAPRVVRLLLYASPAHVLLLMPRSIRFGSLGRFHRVNIYPGFWS